MSVGDSAQLFFRCTNTRPEFDPWQPSKKQGIVAHACNPGFGKVETGRSQEFSDQHVLLNQWTDFRFS